MRRTLRLRRYVHLRSCFIANLGVEITSRGSIILAPVRPVNSKGKLFNFPTGDKIDKHEDRYALADDKVIFKM